MAARRSTTVAGLRFGWWHRRLRYRRRRKNLASTYSGVRVQKNRQIEIVQADILRRPQLFFQSFVKRRQPCIIRGKLPELPKTKQWWAPPSARALTVQVEKRDGSKDAFGKGRKVGMTFGELLDGRSPDHYLTTQELPDGHLLAPPLTALVDNGLPLRPSLMGALVPQSINLWLGHSDTPASSGLHHDFHDNLYVLLRGTKHFRLFSPADAHRMYTHGRIRKVHPNGRINYVGEEETAADGRTHVDVTAEALRQAKKEQKRAERALLEAEEAAEANFGGDSEERVRLEEAEEALDDAMDVAMRREVEHRKAVKRDKQRSNAADAASASSSSNAPPPSFSRIPNLASEISTIQILGGTPTFPLLNKAKLMECDIHEGEMLYLPAGWFHEVSSTGAHVALNFWYHPPDASSFEKPYTAQGFWEREYKRAAKLTREACAQKKKKNGNRKRAPSSSTPLAQEVIEHFPSSLILPGGSSSDDQLHSFLFDFADPAFDGQSLLISYNQQEEEDGEDYDECESIVIIGQGFWQEDVQSKVVALASAEPSRAIRIRHSKGNGRIGLMLRRLPPLLVTFKCGGGGGGQLAVECAHLAGHAAPPPPPELLRDDDDDDEDEEADGGGETAAAPNAMVRRAAPINRWAAPLLWSLGKVYCCHSDRGGVYSACEEDQNRWAKVRWGGHDGERILSVAADAARALMANEKSDCSCTVRVALELVFGSPEETPPSTSTVLSASTQTQSEAIESTSDLREIVVCSAEVVARAAAESEVDLDAVE